MEMKKLIMTPDILETMNRYLKSHVVSGCRPASMFVAPVHGIRCQGLLMSEGSEPWVMGFREPSSQDWQS